MMKYAELYFTSTFKVYFLEYFFFIECRKFYLCYNAMNK